MKKGRAQKYGESLALLLNRVIDTIPESERQEYRTLFLKELDSYSFETRRKGDPINEGCIHELAGIVNFDINNPEHLARLIKEGAHFMYNKYTSKRVLKSLSDKLKN